MIKPYVVILDKQDHHNKVALDRSYIRIPDDQVNINACCIGDIVQVTNSVAATFSELPAWIDLDVKNRYVSIWFNYYD